MARLIVATAIATIALSSATAGAQKGKDAEKASDAASKPICKRFLETGSLVKGYRVCKTKAEWDRERENIRTTTSSTACGSAEPGRC